VSAPDEVPHLDPVAVQAVADAVARGADEVRRRAGAGGSPKPTLPRDPFSLGGQDGIIAKLVEAHRAFDERLAGVLDGAAERAILQTYDTVSRDHGEAPPALPLPESAR
jgi:hypothetical protein